MNRFFALVVLSIGILPQICDATDLMPPHVASRLGLEQSWRRQMHVPAGAQSIVDQQLFVHFEDQREYVEIVVKPDTTEPSNASSDPTVMFRIATDRIEEFKAKSPLEKFPRFDCTLWRTMGPSDVVTPNRANPFGWSVSVIADSATPKWGSARIT
jgi:hypothetical protein